MVVGSTQLEVLNEYERQQIGERQPLPERYLGVSFILPSGRSPNRPIGYLKMEESLNGIYGSLNAKAARLQGVNASR